MLTVQANTGPKWENKIPKAFWRGRDSRQERLDFVVMARKKTELFDAALTNFFFFPYDEKKYGPKGQHVSFYDFFKVRPDEGTNIDIDKLLSYLLRKKRTFPSRILRQNLHAT